MRAGFTNSMIRSQVTGWVLGGAWLALAGLTACQLRPEEIMPEDLQPGEVMVTATRPDSGELGLTGVISLVTAGEAVPDSVAGGEALVRAPGRIRPDIPGNWSWRDPHTLVFVPDKPYEPNTTYTVAVDSDHFQNLGLRLRGPRDFEFRVEPFELLHLDLRNERIPGPDRRYLVRGLCAFNYPVDARELVSVLDCRLEQRGQLLPVSMESIEVAGHHAFQIGPVTAGERDEALQVTVNAGLEATVGGNPLADRTVAETIIPAFERLELRNMQTTGREAETAVVIDFSEPVAPRDLERALTVTPAVPRLRVVGNYGQLELRGDWGYEQTYTLEIAGTLTSDSGLQLERDFRGTVYIDQLDPWLGIEGSGNYLSLRGERKIAVKTINVERLEVSVDRVFANNLVPFLQKRRLSDSSTERWYGRQWSLEDQGNRLLTRDVPVAQAATNSPVVTPVDLGEILDDGSRGVFRLMVRADGSGRAQQKWIVATDLGLVAKQAGEDLFVAVVSVSGLQPRAGVEVAVYSRNNQVLASGRTDSQGQIMLGGLADTGVDSPPFVITATLGDDLSFLAFAEMAVPVGDLDVGGVDLPATGYRAFVYGEREIYRPGETAHLVWLLRDTKLRPAGGFPLTLTVYSPVGQIYRQARVTADRAGAGELDLDLPRWAQTGPYQAVLSLDDETIVGRTVVRVEEFIPDRMKVTAALTTGDEPATIVSPGDSLSLEAVAMTLFGPPAAERPARASIWYEPARASLPDWPDHSFGDPDRTAVPPPRQLGAQATDAEGRAVWDLHLPELSDYHGWLTLRASTEVTELGGGRQVGAAARTVYAPTEHLMGLRNLSAGASDYCEPGQDLDFSAVLVARDGRAVVAADVRVAVYRQRWRTVLRQQGGRYRYVSEYDEELDQEQTLDLAAAATGLTINVARNGSYRLVVETAGGEARGALPFYVYGSGYTPWTLTDPELVNLKLDRETYGTGDVVTASIEAPFAGLMLLTVERERIYHRQWVRLESNTATVQLRLPRDIEPNAYLVATLLRPLDDLDPHAPARAFGAAPVFIDRGPTTLPIELEAPSTMRPRSTLAVKLRLPDLQPGDEARVTLAAVDEGILQLTDAQTPSPLDFFLTRRRLSVGTFDTWSLLLPEYERIKRQSSPGGGISESMGLPAPGQASRLNPLAVDRVKPVALWSGMLNASPEWQMVRLEVPEFNGTLRLMVVAAAGSRFGSETGSVQVADPLVLSPSLPRMLAPGDEIRVPVPVYNGVSEAADASLPVQVSLELDGPLMLSVGDAGVVRLEVPGGEEKVAWFDLRATDEVGAARVTFTAHGGGETVSRSIDLPVRAPWPLEVSATSGTVTEAAPASLEVDDRWYAGTQLATITVAANPIAGFGEALPYLLRYPYGCAEQRTSRAFPLLYFGDLAAQIAPRAFVGGDADYFVNSALDYLATLQRPGQGFAMWPGRHNRTPQPWASVYITHFMVEARLNGYVVNENVLTAALADVARFARAGERDWESDWTLRHRLQARAYACYVLARADRPEKGIMDDLARSHGSDLTISARTQLAGAFALIGNHERFAELLPAADASAAAGRSLGHTWSSQARDDAIRLEVLATVAPDHPQVAVLIQRLARRAENGRWHNTHENGWALLALGKLAAAGQVQPAEGEILVDGEVQARFAAEGVTISSEQWLGRALEIRATGPGTAWYTLRNQGIARRGGETDVDAGLVVRREYFDADGAPVATDDIVQGQTIVCRLSLSSNKGPVADVVVTDLLPAGLEIENPRLDGAGGFDWLRASDRRLLALYREHLDIRDDRLLLFTRARARTAVFHYTLRAVTAGRFVLPPVKAEAMYDPDIRSVSGHGEVTVVAP